LKRSLLAAWCACIGNRIDRPAVDTSIIGAIIAVRANVGFIEFDDFVSSAITNKP